MFPTTSASQRQLQHFEPITVSKQSSNAAPCRVCCSNPYEPRLVTSTGPSSTTASKSISRGYWQITYHYLRTPPSCVTKLHNNSCIPSWICIRWWGWQAAWCPGTSNKLLHLLSFPVFSVLTLANIQRCQEIHLSPWLAQSAHLLAFPYLLIYFSPGPFMHKVQLCKVVCVSLMPILILRSTETEDCYQMSIGKLADKAQSWEGSERRKVSKHGSCGNLPATVGSCNSLP